MNVRAEIFEIRSCIEILANDIKVDTTDQYMLYKVYILGNIHPLGGKSVLNMYDLSSKTIIKSLFSASCQVIGLCSVLHPCQHSIGYMGDGFYRSKDPTNSIKILNEML